MQVITRARSRLRSRKGPFVISSEAAAVTPADVSSRIRLLVEARERARTMIEQLKRKAGSADLDWVQGVANEIATTASSDYIVSKYKELKLLGERAEEKITACLFLLEGLDKLLARHKKYNRETVVYHLRATVSQLTQTREAHKKDKDRLNARLENLLLEIRELEPDALSGAKVSKS